MRFFIDSSHDISICIFSIFTLIPCFHCYIRFGISTRSWLYALTNSGITVRKGGKRPLPTYCWSASMFGRQANLLMSAVFGASLAAPGRRASVDVRSVE